MEDIQQIIVNEHMNERRHDADVRRLRDPSHDDQGADGGGGVGAARTRLGEWLIGVGTAVAGSAGDRRGETADSAL
jgi:hypothetical protein